MKQMIVINRNWEIATSGIVENSHLIHFVVRRHRWERLAFKCTADVVIRWSGSEPTLNIICKKPLPSYVSDELYKLAEQVVNQFGLLEVAEAGAFTFTGYGLPVNPYLPAPVSHLLH